jgi:hypothetical protein
MDQIFDEVDNVTYTKPDELLPKHQQLLWEDFKALADGLAQDRQYWIVSMESAFKAHEAVQEGQAEPHRVNRPLLRGRTRGRSTRRDLTTQKHVATSDQYTMTCLQGRTTSSTGPHVTHTHTTHVHHILPTVTINVD